MSTYDILTYLYKFGIFVFKSKLWQRNESKEAFNDFHLQNSGTTKSIWFSEKNASAMCEFSFIIFDRNFHLPDVYCLCCIRLIYFLWHTMNVCGEKENLHRFLFQSGISPKAYKPIFSTGCDRFIGLRNPKLNKNLPNNISCYSTPTFVWSIKFIVELYWCVLLHFFLTRMSFSWPQKSLKRYDLAALISFMAQLVCNLKR